MTSVESDRNIDNMMLNSKLKNRNQGAESNTMDSYQLQDGGQQQNANMDRTTNDFHHNLEPSHMNTGINNFPQGSGDSNMNNDNFDTIGENIQGSQISNFNGGYNRGNYGMNEQQHGGMSNPSHAGSGDYTQQNNQFNQFGPQNMRPGYTPSSRGPNVPGSHGMTSSGVGIMPPNYNPPPQRIMSGPNIQQQGGPTPTLNQLLQNSNSTQRFPSNYNDYDMNQKSGGDLGNNPGYNGPHSWNPPQQRSGMNPYQQQMPGNQPYRNQEQMYGANQRGSLPPNYPQGNQMGSQPPQQQFSPNSQRFSSGMQQNMQPNRTGQMGMAQQYGQQVMPNQYSPQQNSPMGYYQNQQQTSQFMQQQQQSSSLPGGPHSTSQSGAPSMSIQSKEIPQDQQQNFMASMSGTPNLQPSTPQSQHSPQDAPRASSVPSVGGEEETNARATPTSQASHLQSPHHPRPSPSPVGSRSNTPASVSGNQAGSPMPPRPPSNQVDGQGRMTSPMATQGLNQQMMPPPIGPGGQMGYNNKMNHPSMMGNSGLNNQMGQYNPQFPNQSQGMFPNRGPQQSYGNQQNFNNVQSQMGHGPMYQGNMGTAHGINRNAPMPQFKSPNSYPPNPSGNIGNQYGNYNNQDEPGGMGQSNQNIPNAIMPNHSGGNSSAKNVKNQTSNARGGTVPVPQSGEPGTNLQDSPGPKGAQQAAREAMIAAANSAKALQNQQLLLQQQQQQQQEANQQPPNTSQGNFGQGVAQTGGTGNQLNYMNQNPPSTDAVNQGSQGNRPPSYPGPMNSGGNSNSMNMPNSSHSMPVPNQSPGMYPGGLPSSLMGPTNMSGGMPYQSMAGPNMTNSVTTASNQGNMPNIGSEMNSSMRPPPNMMAPPTMMPRMGGQQPVQFGTNDKNKAVVSSPSANTDDSNTSVTQSINSPLSNVMSTASVTPTTTTESLQSKPSEQGSENELPQNGPKIPPPPPSEDSQQSQPEKSKKEQNDRQTPTPASVAPSPSASMSSLHEEFDNISSPSWPGTPVSKPGSETQTVVHKLIDMGDEPGRKPFLEKLFAFMEEKGSAITTLPTVTKQPVDLFKLYNLVKERGGLYEVTKSKKWRDVCSALSLSQSGSAGFQLRKGYIKCLFSFECKFDKGGIDPNPILAQIEAMKKDSGKKNQGKGGVQEFRPQPFDAFGRPMHMPNNDPMMPPNMNMMQNYGNDGMMGNNTGMMPNNMMPNNMSHGGMMPNAMPGGNMGLPNSTMPSNMGMPNSMGANHMIPGRPGMMPNNNPNRESVSIQDPFADEPNQGIGSSQYPRTSMNSNLPSYSSNLPQPPNNSMNNSYVNRPNIGSSITPSMAANMPPYSSNLNQPIPGNMNQMTPPPPPSFGNDSNVQTVQPAPPSAMNNQMGSRPSIADENFGNSAPSNMPNQTDTTPAMNTSSTASQFPTNRSSGSGTPNIETPPTSMVQTQQGMQAQMPPTSQSSGNQQFPFGNQFRERFENSPQSSQPGLMMPPNQQVRPGMEQSHTNSPFPNRFGSNANQMGPRPNTPQDQYSQPPFGNQSHNQSNFQGQQQQSGMNFQGKRPQMLREMFQQKHYPDYRNRDGYSVYNQQFNQQMNQNNQGPFAGQYQSYNQGPRQSLGPQVDSMHSGRDHSWMRGSGYSQQSGYPSGPQVPSTTGSFGGMINRVGQRMGSPQRPEKGYFPQPKQKSGPMGPSYPPKKEIIFPPDSVEATQPLLRKRRKVVAKDLGQTDAWRLMMALKSGLLAESTWALDTLSILLFDDNAITYFHLRHMPGLVEVLMELFRRCLIEIFGDEFAEMEVSSENVLSQRLAEREDEVEKDALLKHGAMETEDTSRLDEPGNYTRVTRKGKIVKIEENSPESEMVLDDKKWDVYQGFDSSAQDWQHGRGDLSIHVHTTFESKVSKEFLKDCFFGRFRKHLKKTLPHEYHKDYTTDDAVLKENMNSEAEENSCSENEMPTIDKMEGSCSESDIKKERECSKCLENCNENPPTIKQEPMDVQAKPICEQNGDICSNSNLNSTKQKEGRESPLPCNDKIAQENEDSENLVKEEESNHSIPDSKDNGRMAFESLKRKWEDNKDEEVEAYRPDSPPLNLISDSKVELQKRCVCISNIFRSLSFVPGNEIEIAKHYGIMWTLGKLLLLNHTHPKPKKERAKFDRDEIDIVEDNYEMDGDKDWWWETLDELRENALVILANIAGKLNLCSYPEDICRPILDGLLHWAVCPAACAQDPMPTMSPNSVLSPHRLVLETMCKLCVLEDNVNMILATGPFSRIVQFLTSLVKLLANRKEQVMREFAIVLLTSLVQGDDSAARAVALQHPSVSLLIDFLETAEQQAVQIANSHGISMLRDNPEMMGTSLDMLRRAAAALRCMAIVPENKTFFVHQQPRLLALVMSQILDQQVASTIADVMYYCAQHTS